MLLLCVVVYLTLTDPLLQNPVVVTRQTEPNHIKPYREHGRRKIKKKKAGKDGGERRIRKLDNEESIVARKVREQYV